MFKANIASAETFGPQLMIPDLWQQQAAGHLQAGRDVVVHAPTGAGKTYIFDLLVESGFKRNAVFTVPTRALANDKRMEWQARGWRTGISTGDLTEDTDAPVVVATLETQKGAFLRGHGPGLLVIDEYQMLADPGRGINYELAIALAPVDTQLLLLSGSVANPERIVDWLRQIGRQAVLIRHDERPVPQDEIHIDALRPRGVQPAVRDYWVQLAARALAHDLGPLLIFAPRRRMAEELAGKISAALPIPNWLELSPEQRTLAGDSLAKMLRNRVAYHHSGLNYRLRAGLIEPLAKSGQLRVIVATTGLAAGINFSVRSVTVTEREYHHGGFSHRVRPDELLQMFGRAGRRGLDEKGYVLVGANNPRMTEARPIHLKRCSHVDWPSFLGVMHRAAADGRDPVEAANALAGRLFAEQQVRLGLKRFKPPPDGQSGKMTNGAHADSAVYTRGIREILNSEYEWERARPPLRKPMGQSLIYANGRWRPALELPQSLKTVAMGNVCRINPGTSPKTYGRQIPLATFPRKAGGKRVTLVKGLHRALSEFFKNCQPPRQPPARHWTLEALETELFPLLPYLTSGGRGHEWVECNGLISVRLDYTKADVLARVDSHGRFLINPPMREVIPTDFATFPEMAGQPEGPAHKQATAAAIWYQLGLIDRSKQPTRRGVIFSFFNYGEGLAIAAALEDLSYDVDELIRHVANLRAGPRFAEYDAGSSQLGNQCRITYRGANYPGYLHHGRPPEYGDGAAEVLSAVTDNPGQMNEFTNANLAAGDIERALLEWHSLLNHIFQAPDYDWPRWMEFKERTGVFLATHFHRPRTNDLPPLTQAQQRKPVVTGRVSSE